MINFLLSLEMVALILALRMYFFGSFPTLLSPLLAGVLSSRVFVLVRPITDPQVLSLCLTFLSKVQLATVMSCVLEIHYLLTRL